MATANEEKVRAALDKISSGKPLGSAKQRARARAALSRYGIDKQLAFTGPSSTGGGSQGPVTLDELLKGINAARAMVPAEPSNPSWAKGLKVVGKGLDFIDTLGSYVRSSISTVATGIEENDLSKVAGGIPVYNLIPNAIDNFGGDPNAPKGVLSKVFFADKQQEKDFWANTGVGEYLQRAINKRGWQGTPIDNAWVKRVIGLAGDIGTDPLTYVSGGAKAAVTTVGKGAAKAIGKEVVEQGLKQVAKEGVEQVTEQGIKQVAKTAAKDLADNAIEAAAKTKYKYARWEDWVSKARDVAANAADDTERQWALGVVERVQKAKDISSLSSAEVAALGGKRAIFVAGKPIFENNKIIESALRAREALGGASRRGAGKVFNAVVGEGTFGNPNVKRLLKGAMQAGGDNIARALDGIETEKWARHLSGIEATNLGKQATAAVDSLEKLGFNPQSVFRIVQDERLFREAAAANPAAGEALDQVRGIWRSMAEATARDTGKVLSWGDTYAPHILTQEAIDWLDKNPAARKGIPGVAAFEKTRKLRSGQDNTLLLSKMESTRMYGREIPRNLSDAELVDWVNATVKAIHSDAPDFFETDIRKVLDRSVGNYASARHKELFTTHMAERGWMGNDVRELATIMADDTGARDRFIKEQAKQTLGDVFQGASAAQVQVDFVNNVERMLRETSSIGKRVGKPWDAMVARYRALTKSLREGTSVQRIVNDLERQRVIAIESARRAEGDLAALHQAEVDFLGKEIRRIRSSMTDVDQGSYANMLRQVASGVADPAAVRNELEAGAGKQVDALRAASEPAAQRAQARAEKSAPIPPSSRREAASVAKQVWASIGQTVSEALSVKAVNKAAKQAPAGRSLKDSIIFGGPPTGAPGRIGGAAFRPSYGLAGVTRIYRVKEAQDSIRAAVERAGYTFTGFTENLDRVTAADLKRKLQQELLDQIHGKTAALAGENAYQQRLLQGVSKDANKILGPLNKASDQMAVYRQELKQIPDPARYELMDFVGDNPKAASLFNKVMAMTLRADVLQARKIDAAMAEHARLTGEIDEIAQAMGLTGRNVGNKEPIAVSTSGEASFATDPQTRAQMRKLQRDAALLAGGIVDETERKIVEGRMRAGMAEEHAKKLADMFFDDKVAKRQEQPWKRTKNLSKQPTRQARQRVRDVMGARERALIVQNQGQLEEFLQNAFANTVRDSFKELPADVQNLFMPIEQFFKNDGLRNFLNVYDKFNNTLKSWLIAKPGFVFRNMFGGLFVNMLAGVSPEAHFKMMKWARADLLRMHGRPGAWNKLPDYEKMIYKAVRDIQSDSETLVGSMVQRGRPSVLSRFNPGSPNFFYLAANQNFNKAAENTLLRGSMIADLLLKDANVRSAYTAGDQMALRRAVRNAQIQGTRKVGYFHFDYDRAAKSPFENEVLARLVPFYTYTKNVIPMLTAMMIERPKYFAWMNAAARNFQLGVPEDAVLPEYIKESGAIRTPFTVGGNRVYWMQDLPLNQLIDLGNDPINFGASSLSPLVKTPIEWAQGQQFYKRIPITQDMKESKFANVPLLSQALSALGAQRQGDNGQQFMRDDLQYALGQFVPPAYQLGGYMPATETQQLKWPTRVTSDLSGIRLRVNTPEDQKNELARQNIKEREKKAKRTREANRGYGSYPAGYKPRKKKQQ